MLVSNETLVIPLYHGTSTFFIDSISKSGLGGRNIIKELNVLKILRYLFEKADQLLANTEIWNNNRNRFELFASQKITSGGFNFRHGNVYLSPSLDTAKRYAQNNRFGSELISELFDLYDILNNGGFRSDIQDKNLTALLKYFTSIPSPMLVQINNVPISSLRTEKGETIYHQLSQMEGQFSTILGNFIERQATIRKAKKKDIKALIEIIQNPITEDDLKSEKDLLNECAKIFWQQMNFILIVPIEKFNLKIFTIDVNGELIQIS